MLAARGPDSHRTPDRVGPCFARCRCCLPSWQWRRSPRPCSPRSGRRPRPLPARPRWTEAPLSVTIDSRAPPRRSLARGRSRSAERSPTIDTETWTSINLYAFVSEAPMTSAAEIADAADAAPTRSSAPDLTPGTYDRSTSSLPAGRRRTRCGCRDRRSAWTRRASTGSACTHSVSTVTAATTSRTAGPARSSPWSPRTPTASTPPSWSRCVGESARPRRPDLRVVPLDPDPLPGRPLRSLVDFGAAAGSRPISWLVDPAVVNTVESLVAGNPARSSSRPSTRADGGSGRLGRSGSLRQRRSHRPG